ncbi:U4/U6.U5 snRNP associated protein [Marasmius tenuissimus]|uniref:U4/U6.U5 snRNP associated protein n=1 Tax=Marasmius tenuissimus TaxID=585030 RepID=A0ABR2ZIL0_9AGAR
MADKGGAYGTKAGDTDFRKKWDKKEYAERARKRDQEEKECMQENEERLKQGPKRGDWPKPTELMKQREGPLELDKNLNKTMVVQNPGGRGPGQPGFYCEACNRTFKDTTAYLDHINSRAHLRTIGQTTKVERSTLEQVCARIALLREKTKEASPAKAYDFDKRLANIKAKEIALREEKKAQKKAEKEKALASQLADPAENNEMTQMMGFAGFGTSKK